MRVALRGAVGAALVLVLAAPAGAQDQQLLTLESIDDPRAAERAVAEAPAQVRYVFERATPAEVGGISDTTFGVIADQVVSVMSPDQFDALRPGQIAQFPAASLAKLAPRHLERLRPDQAAALRADQVAALSGPQLRAIPQPSFQEIVATVGETAAVKKEQEARTLRRRREAIDPGLTLVGDAFTELAKTGEDSSTEASFGGGVRIETTESLFVAVLRKGTLAPLDTRAERARAILTPQLQDVSASIEWSHWPTRWGDFIDSLVGYHLYFHGGKSNWGIRLADAVEETDDSMALPEIDLSATALTTELGAAASLRYLVEDDQNTIEVIGEVGVSLRSAFVSPAVNDDLAALRAEDPRVRATSFLDEALGTTATNHAALNFSVGLRVNTVVLTASMPFVCSIAGSHGFCDANITDLTGRTLIISASLQAGPMLVPFDDKK